LILAKITRMFPLQKRVYGPETLHDLRIDMVDAAADGLSIAGKEDRARSHAGSRISTSGFNNDGCHLSFGSVLSL
jgi:hypothetical protein